MIHIYIYIYFIYLLTQFGKMPESLGSHFYCRIIHGRRRWEHHPDVVGEVYNLCVFVVVDIYQLFD